MKVFNLINFPNPFSYETVFSFELTMDASKVVLGIYTISGRLVSKFEDTAGMSYGYNEMPIGTGSVVWDGTDVNGDPLANGVYIYKLTATPDSDIYGEGIYKPGNASGKLMIVR
jgi:flagellar hook assembly protein FlgD